MKILSFKIKGYKNIENAEIKLTDITALMSLNSKGKSNLLKGLFFGLVIFTSQHSNNNYYYLSNRYLSRPLNKHNENQPFSLTLLCETTLDNESCEVEYSYELDWTSKTSIKIICESLRIKPASSERYANFYLRNGNEVKYKTSKARACDNTSPDIKDDEMINDFFFNKNIYYKGIIEELSQLQYAIDRHFDNTKTYVSSSSGFLENEFSFCGNKQENTAENLYLLKTNYGHYYSRIINAMKILFDDVTEINVEKLNGGRNIIGAQNFYELYAKQRTINAYINCSEMSDGFKRVLNNLIFLSICEIKNISLVALEEPENSVNPTVFGRYIQIIAEFAQKFNIIITSHSPFLLEYINLNKVYIAVPNSNGNSMFCKIKSTYIKRVTERSERLNISTGTYIFDILANEERFNSDILKEALDIDG